MEVRMKLAAKTALVTGGNSGIGLATARLFKAEGAQVVITGRNQATLDAAAKELGGNVLAVKADIIEAGAADAVVKAAIERFGKLDIVFANAGIAGATPVGQTKPGTFATILQTNITSVFFTIQAAAAHLGAGASIILNGSVHAVLGVPGYSAYAASKAAVRAMTRVLASELAPRGIRVNVVVPGATRTPIWAASAPTEEAFAALEARMSLAIPRGRIGEAEDIAKAVLFLASDDAVHISAAEIVVDGGNTGAPAGGPIFRT
jgi:NAD(P)-dependent dehydrogenase (short-subunit alcohol dehydrogenase family)